MAQRWGKRLMHAWNAFLSPSQQRNAAPYAPYYGGSSGVQQYRTRPSFNNGRTIVAAIYNRIGIDVAGVPFRHVRVDDQDRYLEDIPSGLNDCLTVEANMDQAARAFRQDIVMTLFDRGCIAIVPVDTTLDPRYSGGWDIKSLRIGWITNWYPQHVRVSLYNEKKGFREDVTLPKSMVAIVENPLYSVMNETNSTLQRLLNKLSLLDQVDEMSASGKLDIIIQLPYTIKSEARRKQAEQRRTDMEFQLTGSRYGIAYADATEKITQLNRPAENNLQSQVEYLTKMLYDQLGITETIMNGTADEPTMLNYWVRTIEPLLDAVVEEYRRKFLTKTARTQKQTILYFRDAFKLVPVSQIADIADKFARNEILSSNEIRQALGFKPSTEPKADQLINSNMPQADTGLPTANPDAPDPLDQMNSELDKLLAEASGAGS